MTEVFREFCECLVYLLDTRDYDLREKYLPDYYGYLDLVDTPEFIEDLPETVEKFGGLENWIRCLKAELKEKEKEIKENEHY